MGKTVSIVDVAEHAGVSVSTVSLVMNNRPNVAPDTAAAVWRSVKTLGYRPGGGRGKKRGPKPGPRRRAKSPQILLLQTGHPAAFFRCDLHAALMHGVLQALNTHHATLLYTHAQTADEACDAVSRAKCDGVLLLGTVEEPKLQDSLRRECCVQALGSLPQDGVWDHVTYDLRGAVRSAARWLVDRGHSRCALVGLDSHRVDEIEAVFRVEMRRHDGSVLCVETADAMNLDGIFPLVDGACFAPLFNNSAAANGRATGVFLGSEVLAAPLYRMCRQHDMVPGRDLDVVCTSLRGPILEAAQPVPAIINIHPEQVGHQAVDQVLWRMEHCHEPSVTRLIAPSAVLTDTT